MTSTTTTATQQKPGHFRIMSSSSSLLKSMSSTRALSSSSSSSSLILSSSLSSSLFSSSSSIESSSSSFSSSAASSQQSPSSSEPQSESPPDGNVLSGDNEKPKPEIVMAPHIGSLEAFRDSVPRSVRMHEPVGRSWSVKELRRKSYDDMHKLWLVLYKERNMLLTELQLSRRRSLLFPQHERMRKVRKSMGAIRHVLGERKRARIAEFQQEKAAETARMRQTQPVQPIEPQSQDEEETAHNFPSHHHSSSLDHADAYFDDDDDDDDDDNGLEKEKAGNVKPADPTSA